MLYYDRYSYTRVHKGDTMEKAKIERINFLARKSKTEGLTEEEKLEQQALRKEYIAAMKESLINTLDQVVIVDKEGNQTRLNPKSSSHPKQ